ncbi:hypothetical protein GCM10010347_46740 [Streptomyces cirratus]|uniref:Uncharacterized protein n=1 Tax=Streptomyces cirratus TaxID=68187 RepID=A0ABQ3F1T6_9ACTN|nr:hypothetical protein GCM10010347_46740 [Streptomyces cirratus]
MYRAAAFAPSPPLRTPFLTAFIRRVPDVRGPSSAASADGTAGAVSEGTAESPEVAVPVSGPVSTRVSAGSPDFRKRRFRKGDDPFTAGASQSQSRQIG